MSPALMAALVALRASLDAVMAIASAEMAGNAPVMDPEACPVCGAPAEKQAKAPSMAGMTTACLVCGHTRTTAIAPQQTT